MRHARTSSVVATLVAVACGGGAPPASKTAADSAAAPPNAPGTPTLVVGGRYETLAGTIVCPTAEALRGLNDVMQRGDSAAFVRALDAGHCSPVVAGATVHVAEQRGDVARVVRAGDPATYWTRAVQLSPR